MSTPSERVRAMVAAGRVDHAEGERLLGAITAPAGRAPAQGTRASLLIDPFVRWGGGIAAALGALFAVLGFVVSRWGVRFDGFIDLHVGPAVTSPPHAALEQLAAWPLGALVMWGVARALGGPGRRFVDFLGAVGVARGPVVLLALPLQALAPSSFTLKMSAALALMIVIGLVAVAWQITLLFFGYRNASGLRGPKLGFSLAGAIVVAEVASKLVLYLVNV